MLIKTFVECLTSIDPQKADGNFSEIWYIYIDIVVNL